VRSSTPSGGLPWEEAVTGEMSIEKKRNKTKLIECLKSVKTSVFVSLVVIAWQTSLDRQSVSSDEILFQSSSFLLCVFKRSLEKLWMQRELKDYENTFNGKGKKWKWISKKKNNNNSSFEKSSFFKPLAQSLDWLPTLV
jgi:hypothetical protein